MHLSNWLSVLALVPAISFAQANWNTVTVIASRTSNQQPDQVIYSVVVAAGTDQGLDEVVNTVSALGITPGNLASLYGPTTVITGTGTAQMSQLRWTFQISVPLAKVKETTSALASLQQSMSQKNSGMSLSFSVVDTTSSTPSSANCDFAALVTDARVQAQKLAGSAGFTPGAIVAISSSVSQSVPACSLSVGFALGTTLVPATPNSIAVTATHTAGAVLDQVFITLGVISGPNVGQDEISAALAAAGVTGVRFTGVTSAPSYNLNPPQNQANPTWSFSLVTPLAKLKDTLAQLTAAQLTMTKQNPSLTVTFMVNGLQPSAQSQPVCQQADLIADARTQAQKLASAAGLSLGGILTLADGAASTAIPTAVERSGDFATFLLAVPAPVTYGCGIAVQFQIL